MDRLLRNKWFRLGVGYMLVAVVAAAVVMAATGGFGAKASVSDRIAIASSKTFEKPQSFPLTVEEAELAEWKLATWCLIGQGRFFRKGEGEEPDPLMLIFSTDNRLVGINLHSAVEQPSPPWERFPDGIATGFKGRDSDHWGLGIYVSRPLDACDLEGRSSGLRGIY